MSIISKWNTSFKKTASRFKKDEGGQFAILFAITGVVVTLAGGIALDTARLYSAKTKLDQAVDAAILATTRDLTSGAIAAKDAEEAVSNFMFANINAKSVNGAPIKIDSIYVDKTNKTVAIDAHLMLPMTLTAIAGYEELKVATTSKAEYSDDRVEIAMALDVTGSMGGIISGTSETKMQALKAAAKNAINQLVPAGTSSQRVRIGLVPYSGGVNATPVLSKINYTGTSGGCVAERTTAWRFNDGFASTTQPLLGLNLTPGQYNCPTSAIVPMTNNNDKLVKTIDALPTEGHTAGHVGIAWAQYMLSSKWNNAWPGDVATGSDAAPATSTNVQKFAIIMTDGEFNTFLSNGLGNGNGKAKSREYAKKLCANMKNSNVKVFTINFAGGPQAENLMKKCASPDTTVSQFFFSADDGDELKKAFDAIAKAINTLKLIG